MKKEFTKVFSFFVVGFFVSIFFLSLVIAKTDSPITEKLKELTNSGGEVFNKIFGTTLTGEPIWELAATKFLLMLLIFSIVFGISDIFIMDTGRGKTAFKIIFSVVVAYLSVVYLAPTEIYAALLGWGAMAVTITAIIPFVVILGLSWKLASNPNPAKMLMQKLLLAIFAVYLGVRLIILWAYNTDAWLFALPIYVIAFVVTVAMLIFNRTIQRFILTTQVASYVAIGGAQSANEAAAEMIMLQEKIRVLEKVGAKAAAASLKEEYDRLESQYTSYFSKKY